MSFETRPKHGPVPRAEPLSDAKKRAQADARLQPQRREEARLAIDDLESLRRNNSPHETPVPRPRVSRIDLENLNRSYAVPDRPGTARVARETRPELEEALNELAHDARRIVSEDVATKTHDEYRNRVRRRRDEAAADASADEFRRRLEERRRNDGPELSYGDLADVDLPPEEEPWRAHHERRARRIMDESAHVAEAGGKQFRNTMIARHGYVPTPRAELGLLEDADRGMKNSFDSGLHLFDEDNKSDRASFDFRPAGEAQLGREDILDLPAVSERAHKGEVINLERSGVRGRTKERKRPEPRIFDGQVVREPDEALHRETAPVDADDARLPSIEQPSVELSPEIQQDVRTMNAIAALEANKTIRLRDANDLVARAEAEASTIGQAFEATTGVSIESYLSGTASLADRIRVNTYNIGRSIKQLGAFIGGIFGPRMPEANQHAPSPQTLLERYENARQTVAEAQAGLAGAGVDAQKIQDQIDALTLPEEERFKRANAAFDRAERARNMHVLGRSTGVGALAFSDRPSRPRTNEAAVETREEPNEMEQRVLENPPTTPDGYHPTAVRTGHRDRSHNPLTTAPSLRKLAPLYAGPEPSRTNGMRGLESYDTVMDVPGFQDRYNAITDEDAKTFVGPEGVRSFGDALEVVASNIADDRKSGIAIADRAYELLESSANPSRGKQAHESFILLGQNIRYLDKVQWALAAQPGYERDLEEAVQHPSAANLTYFNARVLKAVEAVGRQEGIPTFQRQRAVIAEAFSALLRAKEESLWLNDDDVLAA